ncbi:GNAT family N-acetyltransferase [Acaryochloris sp. IP29b_bin.148]|uniref:GNAT family N-acetyltransferase n=1 Tax=Acaryochloris sp. IP29b_bin.148 TaxID=2969218 RepID=UPI00261759FD|nr:GNAT family N-acetyltransferase [Acaryochloris sp. IP29b_bin.148]
MVTEFQDAGETDIHDQDISFIQDSFHTYLCQLEDNSQGRGLRPGFVPATTFWLINECDRVLGESRLRHRLTPSLEDWGGHIGYMVRPTERGKGNGTKLLALTLMKAQQIGLQRVLVTCNTDNQASARVIQKNGGVLASQSHSLQTVQPKSRYWIDLKTTS